jgi:uncharacterized iron-regulated protein
MIPISVCKPTKLSNLQVADQIAKTTVVNTKTTAGKPSAEEAAVVKPNDDISRAYESSPVTSTTSTDQVDSFYAGPAARFLDCGYGCPRGA